jgi:hypothetical protein
LIDSLRIRSDIYLEALDKSIGRKGEELMEITLNLPDTVVEHMTSFGQATERDVATVLAETIEMMWPAWGTVLNREEYPPVDTLSDQEVLTLAHSKMSQAANDRLGALQAKGKTGMLTASEQFELLVLIHHYQIEHLRKSEGLAEAVRRGLQAPFPA